MANPQTTIERYVGTILPTLEVTFEGVDMTGYPDPTLRAQKPDGSFVESTATITDAPNGVFLFAFQAGDFNVAGDYPVQIRIVDTFGSDQILNDVTFRVLESFFS